MRNNSKEPHHSRLQLLCSVLCSVLFSLQLPAFSSAEEPVFTDTCYLENNYVLLYKIINWWNDCDPEDDQMICGNQLRCSLDGPSRLHHDPSNGLLTIESDYLIEELISITSSCDSCRTPASIICTSLNANYFGQSRADTRSRPFSTINTITVANISTDSARLLRDMRLGFEVEGMVSGLLWDDGRIALHQSGNFLKKCQIAPAGGNELPPISLTLKNLASGETLAAFVIHEAVR